MNNEKHIDVINQIKLDVSEHVVRDGANQSAFERDNPNFARALIDNRSCIELEYTRAYALFMVELLKWRSNGLGAESKVFFSRSYTHVMLCHRLLASFGEAVVTHSSVKIGCRLERLLDDMQSAEGKSLASCKKIIRDAIELGFVERTLLNNDRRRHVLFLTNMGLVEWLESGVGIHTRLANSTNLGQVLLDSAEYDGHTKSLKHILEAAKLDTEKNTDKK